MNSIARSPKQRLSKSRFTLGLSCPTKLYFAADSSYANQKLDDPFLAALADGGYQVGELAKAYFPGGVEVESLNVEEALRQTEALLKSESVTIFEAAIAYENCFVRVDVLEKVGDRVVIHEVKAKSYDSNEGADFLLKNGGIRPKWKPYLYDVAFQKWVVRRAYPDWSLTANLMLADKSKRTETAGMNQHFPIKTGPDGRKRVVLEEALTAADLHTPIINSANVEAICDAIYNSTDHGLGVVESFTEMVGRLSEACENHTLIPAKLGKHCKDCEYFAKENDKAAGLKDGRIECFGREGGYDASIFDEPTVLDLWFYPRKDELINAGIIRLKDITEDQLVFKPVDVGMSTGERQWKQIEKVKYADDSIYVDLDGLKSEMSAWTYPLHFIDFETTSVAVPFGKGHRPYESIAFQFSHHIVEADGRVRHAGEFLSTKRGYFPNYDFVRALKSELENDDGTIFKYSNHENTYLNTILEQLEAETSPPADRDELIEFIKEITHSKEKAVVKWTGPRDMVDLLEVVKKYYYDPRTNGSNSIKRVLPAIISRSDYLQTRYGSPIYGDSAQIPSRNFPNWTWIKPDGKGGFLDPYLQLPKLFTDVDQEKVELLTASDSLKDGGAALTSYARMQFEFMSEYEREELRKALLKYCELDTLAMVMIYEHWRYDL